MERCEWCGKKATLITTGSKWAGDLGQELCESCYDDWVADDIEERSMVLNEDIW